MAVKIFTQFTSDDFGKTTHKISEGLFTNGVGELNAFYTSSTQAASARGAYAIDVYHEVTSSTTSEVQFSIAYGHISGSGSICTNDSKPSKAIHSQYRNLLLDLVTTLPMKETSQKNNAPKRFDTSIIILKKLNLTKKLTTGILKYYKNYI